MAIVWELVRVSPAQQRGERFLLDSQKSTYLMGRSQSCDIRLISPTASREHAELRRLEDGSWHVVSLPGKQVIADGEPIDGPCELCEGLNLEMGRDRLRCQTPGADEHRAEEQARRDVARQGNEVPSHAIRVGLAISLATLALVLGMMILWRVNA
jgi:hypothetical protein